MAKVTQVQLATIYGAIEDVAVSGGSTLQRLKSDFSASISILNVPPIAPPDAPRVMVSTSSFLITLAAIRTDIFVRVPEHLQRTPDDVLDYASKIVERLESYTSFRRTPYSWSGIVATLNYPLAAGTRWNDVSRDVLERMIKISSKGKPIASFQLQFGVQDGRYNVTYTTAGYETVNLVVPSNRRPPQLNLQLRVGPQNVTESGISITLDINNRPASAKGSVPRELADILNEMKSRVPRVLHELNLEGVVSNE